MDIEAKIASLEGSTETLFGHPVPHRDVGIILEEAADLWLRQCKVEGSPVVRGRDFIVDFPAKLLDRVERIIRTLETAFDWKYDDDAKNDELVRQGKVRVDGWMD